MRITSKNMLFMGVELLLIVTLLPITQCFPSIVRWMLQILSISMFLIGLALHKDLRYLAEYFICVLFAVVYVYNVWKFNQSIVTCLFNVMAAFAFAFYGVIAIKIKDMNLYHKRVMNTTIILTIITSITTIVGLQQFPLAVRELGRVDSGYSTSGQAFLDLKFKYKLMNIASWSIVYGIVFTVPWFLNQLREKKSIKYAIGLIIVLFCLLKAQLTIGLIIATMLVFFSFYQPGLKTKDVVRTVVILLIGVVLILLGDEILMAVVAISSSRNLGMISNKLQDLLCLMQGNQTGDVLARFERYTRSLYIFLEHPFMGLSIHGVSQNGLFGNHSDFLDLIGYYGIFGIVVLTFMIRSYGKNVIQSQVITDKWRVIVPFLAFILAFILNPVWYSPQVFATAIMLPCCAYLKYNDSR